MPGDDLAQVGEQGPQWFLEIGQLIEPGRRAASSRRHECESTHVGHTAQMQSEHEQDAHEDTRGAEPPAGDESADADSAGPQGNPEVDEEALQHRQQERDEG